MGGEVTFTSLRSILYIAIRRTKQKQTGGMRTAAPRHVYEGARLSWGVDTRHL
jgi:hypothetical protein